MAPHEPDDLTDALTPSQPPSGGNQKLREALLSQTTGVIRTRRRLKRLRLAAALAVCYLAGMATLPLWHAAESGSATAPRQIVQPSDDHAVAPSQLAASTLTPYELLRLKGDRELKEQGDVAGASRTYRRALQVASADQREPLFDQDSWLLMVLKNDQSLVPSAENIP